MSEASVCRCAAHTQLAGCRAGPCPAPAQLLLRFLSRQQRSCEQVLHSLPHPSTALTLKMPSVQSPVAASMRPNIWGAVMALGFMRHTTCLVPSSVSAAARQSMMVDLPAPAGPTTMMPCRT